MEQSEFVEMQPIYNIKVIRLCGALFIIVSTLLCYLYFFGAVTHNTTRRTLNKNVKKPLMKPFMPREPPFSIEERIVHLDLKGAPPKVSYYSKLFPLLHKLGATGVLMEYEDMFPYDGQIMKNVAALNAYTLQDIIVINSLAKENHLTIIPLIQTFGHLEYLLKLEKFMDYREVLSFPSVICPTYSKTLGLIEDMIDQIVGAHPESDIIHIGSDEVAYLGYCERCANHMLDNHLSKNQLYLEHVQSVIKIIRTKYPRLKILAWDDHFRTMKITEIEKSHIPKNFEPVVWMYSQDVYDVLGPSLWDMYSKVFPDLWVASAFKGATGSNKYTSDVNHYLQNHKSWISVILEHNKKINFKGIILTGWQRYDHFAVLCELLPVGIPTLAMSLRLLRGFKDSALGPPLEVAKILQCSQPYGLIGTAFGSPKCKFPGGEILENVIHFHQLKQEFDEILEDSRVKGWLSDYNRAHTFSNNQYVKSVLIPMGKIKGELDLIKGDITTALSDVYDQYTVDEWIETFIEPFEKKVLTMWQAKQNLLNKESWPRRPLNFDKDF